MDNEIVVSFFGAIAMMIKSPQAQRLIDWHLKFFERRVSSLDKNSYLYQLGSRMLEELILCNRRKRSRYYMYNMSNIDEVYNQYYINKSPATLGRAWDLFQSGAYRLEV